MNPIVRNFMSIIRRFKLAMALNVLGLAMAFAAFVVIMMQISYEHNFENCHPNADRIYRANLNDNSFDVPILPRLFVDAIINSSPFIEAGTIINPYTGNYYLLYRIAMYSMALACSPASAAPLALSLSRAFA